MRTMTRALTHLASSLKGMISDLDPVTEAIDRLNADLSRTLQPPPRLSFILTGDSNRAYLTRRDVPLPYVASGGVNIHSAPLDLQERLARELSDALASGHFGDRVSWPTCPEHGTAIQARRQDDAVMWMCRGAGAYHCLALLGSLGYEPLSRDPRTSGATTG